MKTYSIKPTDIKRQWYLIDASEAPLGRVATTAASLLLGKGKAQYSHHIDCGDYVIIINAAELKVSGNKLAKKKYYHHSHYPGGLKQTSLAEQMAKDPTIPIVKAVRGMLPVNKLRDERLKRLKVHAGSEHAHSAQQPSQISLRSKT